MKKKVSILGSTGSIGVNALKVISHLKDDFEVVGLTAGENVDLLLSQIHAFSPKRVCIGTAEGAERLKSTVKDFSVEIVHGEEGLEFVAGHEESDIVISALMGAVGLRPGLTVLRHGKRLALANKESLVMAGPLMMEMCRTSGAEIIPIDSEPSAIFQAMQSGLAKEVRRIFLTASGGPFAQYDKEQIRQATPEQALNHPIWQMGRKITIDSATMMNKALEIIESRWLFDLDVEQIEVLVHPQSIIHSLVEFQDSSVVAQMGVPDMCVPIQYALTYPNRSSGQTDYLNLAAIEQLTFHKPDLEKFPALALGFEVAQAGGTAGAVMSSANEVAVAAFLNNTCSFPQIVETVRHVLGEHHVIEKPTMEHIFEASDWAMKAAQDILNTNEG